MADDRPVTYYELLEVASTATSDDIRAAFRRKRRDAHPDRGGSAALWRLYQQAHDTLIDATRRAAYDSGLSGDAPQPGADSRRDTASPPARRPGPKAERPMPRWTPPPLPAPVVFPVPGQPPAPGDSRLQVVAKPLRARIALAAGWVASGFVIAYGTFAIGAGAIAPQPGSGVVERVLEYVPLMVVFALPPALVTNRRRTDRRAAARHNAAVAEHDAALDRRVNEGATNQRAWGTPGGGLSRGRFGHRADTGRAGEELTAALLADGLADVPAARTFHGLRWPGTRHADIDHVVLVGTRLAVIDSKNWRPGDYWWDGRAMSLYRNGAPLPVPGALDAALALASQMSVPVDYCVWVVVHGDDIRVENHDTVRMRFVTADALVPEVGRWLTHQPFANVVDRRLIADLTAWLPPEQPANATE